MNIIKRMLRAWGMTTVSMAALAAVMLQAGCVSPGPVDPSVVSRYQAAMAQKGPQDRDGESALSPYLPPSNPVTPTLNIIPAAQKGQWDRVELSLDEAVMIALANNLDVRVVSYTPAISREQVVQAAAEFDYTLFGSYNFGRTKTWGGPLAGANPNQYDHDFEFGIRQKTVTGATWALTSSFNATRNKSTGTTARGYTPSVALDLRQPLLRGGGVERNLSDLRIARLNHKTTMLQFRQQVNRTVTTVVTTYWELAQARRVLEIQVELLANTESTYRRVYDRRELDASAVAIKQAEAAVASRRATLILAQKDIEDLENELSRLLADKTLNIVDNVEIIPTTLPGTDVLNVDVKDQLVSALKHSPALEQARLAIQAAEISVRVAENEALPKLDFVGNVNTDGGGGTFHRGMDSLTDGDFISYDVGLEFEYPMGNRLREAQLQQRRYEQQQSVADLQLQADQVGTAVRERVRAIYAAYDSILAQRIAVAAESDKLQALEDSEEIRELTPEFLQVKLAAQQSLALSQRAEARAIADYNIAVAELNRVTGTALQTRQVKMALPAIISDVRWSDPTSGEELWLEEDDGGVAPSDIESQLLPVESGRENLVPEMDQPDLPSEELPALPIEEMPELPVDEGAPESLRPDFSPFDNEDGLPLLSADS